MKRLRPQRRFYEASPLRRERLGAGMRLFDVATKTGISISRLSLIETGHLEATPEELSLIRRATGSEAKA